MSTGGVVGVAGAGLARELAEAAWAGTLSLWGCTPPGDLALRWLLGPGRRPAAAAPSYRAPVVLVHGYGGSRSTWLPLERELRRAGFGEVRTFGYTPVATSLDGVARALRADCSAALDATGSDHLHLVGHSLGGVVSRYAVQRLGLAASVRTAVTVAAPHRGTALASWGWGPLARALRPGSPVLAELDRGPAGGVRWVSCFSDRDLVVRPGSARLDEQGLHAVNVEVPGVGHLGILRAPAFLRSVVRLLLAAEASSPVPAPGPAAAPVAS